MVSFWPFKAQDTSAASFEKVLSSLSNKINKESARNDSFRQRQRRVRVLWTLYTSFAYILAALILTLVTGWSNWTAVEYTAIAATPVIIFSVRYALDAYFNYRLSVSQSYLDVLLKQREDAITKLKEATKYNSTQQLLDKYSATPQKTSTQTPTKSKPNDNRAKTSAPPVQRTGIAPPPTANIPGRQPPSFPTTPQIQQQQQQQSTPTHSPHLDQTAEFAPNAFTASPPRPQHYESSGPRWYDRILDVVLGDDETQPKNRIVLICQNCRTVNGQAPPGTTSLDDLGKWRCVACAAWNGHESEAKKMIRQIAGNEGVKAAASGGLGIEDGDKNGRGGASKGEDDDVEGEDDDGGEILSGTPPSASTRSKARERRKD